MCVCLWRRRYGNEKKMLSHLEAPTSSRAVEEHRQECTGPECLHLLGRVLKVPLAIGILVHDRHNDDGNEHHDEAKNIQNVHNHLQLLVQLLLDKGCTHCTSTQETEDRCDDTERKGCIGSPCIGTQVLENNHPIAQFVNSIRINILEDSSCCNGKSHCNQLTHKNLFNKKHNKTMNCIENNMWWSNRTYNHKLAVAHCCWCCFLFLLVSQSPCEKNSKNVKKKGKKKMGFREKKEKKMTKKAIHPIWNSEPFWQV